MNKRQILEILKDKDDDCEILIYDSCNDIDLDSCSVDGDGHSLDQNGNRIQVDPSLYLRYLEKGVPNTEFQPDLEILEETNVVILKLV